LPPGSHLPSPDLPSEDVLPEGLLRSGGLRSGLLRTCLQIGNAYKSGFDSFPIRAQANSFAIKQAVRPSGGGPLDYFLLK